jgi:hypothetical protein
MTQVEMHGKEKFVFESETLAVTETERKVIKTRLDCSLGMY